MRGLEAGMGVTLKVRATNHRGQSASINLEADIMKVAEKRMGECSAVCSGCLCPLARACSRCQAVIYKLRLIESILGKTKKKGKDKKERRVK